MGVPLRVIGLKVVLHVEPYFFLVSQVPFLTADPIQLCKIFKKNRTCFTSVVHLRKERSNLQHLIPACASRIKLLNALFCAIHFPFHTLVLRITDL